MVAAGTEPGSSPVHNPQPDSREESQVMAPVQDPRPVTREGSPALTGQPGVVDWPTLRPPATTLLRARLRRDLLALAVDVVGRCEHDELSREEKELLQAVMRAAVDEVADEASRRLWVELAGRLATLPPRLRARLERSLTRGALGLD